MEDAPMIGIVDCWFKKVGQQCSRTRHGCPDKAISYAFTQSRQLPALTALFQVPGRHKDRTDRHPDQSMSRLARHCDNSFLLHCVPE